MLRTTRDCPERNHLIKEWHEAVATFSNSVSQLKASIGNDHFEDQHQVTELARLHAENVRTMLELHRAEHGC
jgi:hypothetical protein